MGWKAGVITFLGDFCKAIVAVLLCKFILGDTLYGFYAGIGVVVGHNWPVFLQFKGGKGIAATVGVLFAIDPKIGLIIVVIMATIIGISRYVSLGSVIMAISIPILMSFFYISKVEYIILGIVLMIFALYRHRANIKRLLSGTENKLGYNKNIKKK